MTDQPTTQHDDDQVQITDLSAAAARALTPRQQPCTHPVRRLTSLDGNTVREQCRLCDVHLTTDRVSGVTTVEVTG